MALAVHILGVDNRRLVLPGANTPVLLEAYSSVLPGAYTPVLPGVDRAVQALL